MRFSFTPEVEERIQALQKTLGVTRIEIVARAISVFETLVETDTVMKQEKDDSEEIVIPRDTLREKVKVRLLMVPEEDVAVLGEMKLGSGRKALLVVRSVTPSGPLTEAEKTDLRNVRMVQRSKRSDDRNSQ